MLQNLPKTDAADHHPSQQRLSDTHLAVCPLLLRRLQDFHQPLAACGAGGVAGAAQFEAIVQAKVDTSGSCR